MGCPKEWGNPNFGTLQRDYPVSKELEPAAKITIDLCLEEQSQSLRCDVLGVIEISGYSPISWICLLCMEYNILE